MLHSTLKTAQAHTRERRVLHNLPIAVLYEWLCTAQTPHSWSRCRDGAPFALSSTLLGTTSLKDVHAVRPRMSEFLYMALLALLAQCELSSAPSRHGRAAALRDWSLALAQTLCVSPITAGTKTREAIAQWSAAHDRTKGTDETTGCAFDIASPVQVLDRLPHTTRDGQARRLLIFSTLLGLLLDPAPHTALPWLSAPSSTATSASDAVPARTLSALFPRLCQSDRTHDTIFSCDAAGRPLPSLLLRAHAVQQSRVRVRLLVEKLLHHGTVAIKDDTADRTSEEANTPRRNTDHTPVVCGTRHDGWSDWLDWVESEALASLAAQGSVHALHHVTGADARVWLRGAVHHLLATAVEDDALALMTRLLLDYLCGAWPNAWGSAGLRVSTGAGSLHNRLERLSRQPEQVLMTSLTSTALHQWAATTSAAVADEMARTSSCLLGSLCNSHLVSAALHALPCAVSYALTDAGAHTTSFYWTASALLVPRAPQPQGDVDQSQSGASAADSVSAFRWRHGCRHVVLLRIDAEGDWLPPAESTRNTQTFFSYYANDEGQTFQPRKHDGRHAKRHGSASSADSDELSGETSRFALLEARQAGRRDTRDCARASGDDVEADSTATATPQLDQASQARRPTALESQAEALARVAWVRLRRMTTSGDADDQAESQPSAPHLEIPHHIHATLRLYVYALLLSHTACTALRGSAGECVDEGLHAVLTPERAPPFMKHFGLRHGAWLRAVVWEHIAADLRGSRLIEEPIHLVDEVSLEYFECLLARVRRVHRVDEEVSRAPRPPAESEGTVASSAAVLCRDCVRTPAYPTDALLRVQHVSTTTSAQLFGSTRERACLSSPSSPSSPLTAYVHDPHTFFTQSGGAPAETPPAPGRACLPQSFQHQQKTQCLCLIQLDDYQLDDATHIGVQPNAGARLVLVAPTPSLAALYESTMRRTADALLSLYAAPEAPNRLLLVDGGGAYFIAVAAQLRRVSDALSVFAARDAERSHGDAAATDEGRADSDAVRPQGNLLVRLTNERGGCGDSLAASHAPHRQCLAWLLRLLATALLSVPLCLWERKNKEIAYMGTRCRDAAGANGASELRCGMATGTRRRAQWALHVEAAMQACASRSGRPAVSSVTVELVPHGAHMARLLAALRRGERTDARDTDAGGGDDSISPPLVEPTVPNRMAIRGALELLLLTLLVSAP